MRRASFPVLGLLALLTLSACVPRITVSPARTPALDLRGPAPDVVLLSMSGRCGPPCQAPRDNWDYLTSRGTVDRLADVFAQAGYRVQVAGYASHLPETFTPPFLDVPQRGFLALQADLERLRQGWLARARPPRVVLLGHSHGVAWLHHLTRLNLGVPVALQVDLDGICLAWTTDYRVAARGASPAGEGELTPLDACASVNTARGRVLAKDVVWPSVARNLEVQSKRVPARTSPSGGLPVNYLFERAENLRLDGTQTGIERFISPREDHSAVSYPSSDALAWVAERAAEVARGWQAEDAARGGAPPPR